MVHQFFLSIVVLLAAVPFCRAGLGGGPSGSSLFPESSPVRIAGLPYIAASVPPEAITEFREKFRLSVHLIESGNDSSALFILLSMHPAELVSGYYASTLLSGVYSRMGMPRHADSILAQCLNGIKEKAWKDHFYRIRYALYPAIGLDSVRETEFLESHLSADYKGIDKIGIILRLMALKGFKGDKNGQPELFKKLFQLDHLDPRLDSVYQAVFELSGAGNDTGEVEMVLARYEAGRRKFKPAIKRIQRLIAEGGNKQLKSEAEFFLPELFMRQGKYSKAIKYYRKNLKTYGDHPAAIGGLARCFAKKGDPDGGKEWYQKYIDLYPDRSKVEEIFWLWAWDAEDAGQYEEAIAWYAKLIPRFIDGKRGQWARFRIGYVYFKKNRYDSALIYFRKTQEQKTGLMSIPGGLYWTGKTLHAMGKKDSAKAVFLETFQRYPLNFYGHMAKTALKNMGAWKPSYTLRLGLQPGDTAAVTSWLQSLSGYEPVPDSGIQSPFLGLEDLFDMGLDTLAQISFDIMLGQHGKNPWFLYHYAVKLSEYWEEKSYYLSRKLSYRIGETEWGRVPVPVLRLLYPRPFKRFVSPWASKFKLQENFVYALMKQESGFAPRILSPVGAVGLMQIMPATGRVLAKAENLQEFQPAMLRDPEINVRLGTSYLHSLGKDYQNNLLLVLCNYNAGPEATRRWAAKHGNEYMEFFVEEIGYHETRDYTKKVMGNFWNFTNIYSTP